MAFYIVGVILTAAVSSSFGFFAGRLTAAEKIGDLELRLMSLNADLIALKHELSVFTGLEQPLVHRRA